MTEHSVDTPAGMMPGKHGGLLRRGGGKPPVSAAKKEALAFMRDHAADAARALLMKALQGDVRAAELVLAYAIGKPVDKLELSGVDGGPVQFLEGFDDHEREVLRAAIDAEIAAREKADGATAGDSAGVGPEVRQ